jgi:hypothetical protein
MSSSGSTPSASMARKRSRKARIEAAFALTAVVEEPDVAVTSPRIPREQPETTGLTRSQPDHTKGPLTRVSAGQWPFQHVVAGEGFEPSKLFAMDLQSQGCKTVTSANA